MSTSRLDPVSLCITLIAQAGGKALSAAGIPGGDVALQALLKAMLDIQDQQAQALARIDANVQRLLDGPWNSAWMYIREASLPASPVEVRKGKLEYASMKLHEAVPLPPERSFGRAYACLDLAMVLHVLEDLSASQLYAHSAVEAAVGYVKDVKAHKVTAPQMRAVKVRRGAQWSLSKTASTIGYPIIGRPLLGHMDKRTNEWLMHIYQELSGVGNAAVQLCGPQDETILTEVAAAPLNLRCQNGEIGEGRRLWT